MRKNFSLLATSPLNGAQDENIGRTIGVRARHCDAQRQSFFFYLFQRRPHFRDNEKKTRRKIATAFFVLMFAAATFYLLVARSRSALSRFLLAIEYENSATHRRRLLWRCLMKR